MLAIGHGRTTFPVLRAFPRLLGTALYFVGLAALIAATPATEASLGGIAVGKPIGTASAVYPQGRVSKVGSISILRVDRPGGGKLTAYSDARGVVWQVRFDGDPHERGTLQLPCGGDFDLQSSHVDLDSAASKSGCTEIAHSWAYSLPDRSVFDVSFFGPRDGALQTAIWSGWGIPLSSQSGTPPAGACTTAGEEAVVVKRAALDVSQPDAQKALATGASPDVDVEVQLGPDGLVKRASMYRSSGNTMLDDAAIAAVQNSLYRPKRIGCRPTYGVYQFPFEVPH